MSFTPTTTIEVTIQLENNSQWKMVCAPTSPDADTALSNLKSNKSHINELTTQLINLANNIGHFPTDKNPLIATIHNDAYQQMQLAFWFKCLTPEAYH